MVKQTRARQTRSRQAKITCQHITALILDYVTGELDPDTTVAFEAHLHLCPDCVAFLSTYKKTIQATRSLRYEEIPSEMVTRVRRFLQARIKGVASGR